MHSNIKIWFMPGMKIHGEETFVEHHKVPRPRQQEKTSLMASLLHNGPKPHSKCDEIWCIT